VPYLVIPFDISEASPVRKPKGPRDVPKMAGALNDLPPADAERTLGIAVDTQVTVAKSASLSMVVA
jgi:hypothetical protein